jgi:transcription antitermination protein NusB
MAGPRRRSREIALQILHQVDVSSDDAAGEADVMIGRYFEHLASRTGPADEEDAYESAAEPTSKIDRPLIEEIVRGVCKYRVQIDEQLTTLSRNWRLERMALVDRNVIRIALYELAHCPTVPVNVVLNEAVELAKRYGTAEGAAFANGLLDRALTDLNLRR